MADFKLPDRSTLKWKNPGNRPPLPNYPIISCRTLFTPNDFQEAEGIDRARKVAFPGGNPPDWTFSDVYFIKGEGVDHVKIGRSINTRMDAKLATLQTGSPVKLSVLMVIDCEYYESSHMIEFRMHELFKQYRIHGEWFKIQGELLEFIKQSGVSI